MENFRGSLIIKSISSALIFTTLAFTMPVYADPAVDALPTNYVSEQGNSSYSVNGNVGTLNSTGGPSIGSHEDFNIGSAATFNANIDVAHLNRVRSGNPSEIFGAMNINGGKFFLVNTGGIYFAPGAQVNASGLVASSLDINNQDFMNGHYRFSQNGLPGAVVNEGNMNIGKNGLALIGGSAQNTGIIEANESSVVLAGGKEMTLSFDNGGLISVLVDKEVSEKVTDVQGKEVKDGVLNSGVIRANGGKVFMTSEATNNIFDKLVNQRGLVEANSVGAKTGEIVLSSQKSSGIVENSGTLNAKGVNAGEKGGNIDVLGDVVVVDGQVNASGDAGGGQVRLGGDYQGQGSARNASYTFIAPDAKISADATFNGNGGRVIAYSNNGTQVYGKITARGGVNGGDGGLVETSGHDYLSVDQAVDASAPNGKAGVWLLDPLNIDITGATANTTTSGANPITYKPNNAGSTINVATINAALNAGTDVIVNTQATVGAEAGNITVTGAISKTGGVDTSLTLKAAGGITVNNTITSSSNRLNVVFTAAGSVAGNGTITVNSAITTNGGDATFTANDLMTLGADINAGAGNVSLTSTLAGTQQTAGVITANTLSVNVAGNGDFATSTNQVATLGTVNVGANTFSFKNGQALNQSGILTASVLNLDNTGNADLSSKTNQISALGTVNVGANAFSLKNGQALSQNNVLTAGTLNLTNTAGDTDFSSQVNQIANLGTVNAGANILSLQNGQALTQSGVLTANTFNLTNTAGNTNLGTQANQITNLGTVNVGANTFSLQNGKALNQNGILTANTFNLTNTSGNTDLSTQNNQITHLGTINAASRVFSLQNGQALDQTGVVTASTLNLTNTTGNTDLSSQTNQIAALGTVNAGANTFSLKNGQALTQSGALTANTLNLTNTSGTTTLNNSGNAVSVLGTVDATGQSFSLTDNVAGGLTQTGVISANNFSLTNTSGNTDLSTQVNQIASLGTVNAGANTLSLQNGQALTQSGVLTAGTFNLNNTSGNTDLSTQNNQISNLGTINATGRTFSLQNGKALNQTGALTATTLNLTNTVGDTNLGTQANQIGTLGTINAGARTFSLQNGQALNQTGVLTANTFNLANTGNVDLSTQNNQISNLGTVNAGANTFALQNGKTLAQTGALTADILSLINTVGDTTLDNASNAINKLGNINAAGRTFTLFNTLALTQVAATSITALNLLLQGTNSFTLTEAGNDVTTLAANTTANVSYTDANDLTIGVVGATRGVQSTGTVNISTVNGDLTVTNTGAANDVTGSSINLTANGAGKNLNLLAGSGFASTGTTNLTGETINLVTNLVTSGVVNFIGDVVLGSNASVDTTNGGVLTGSNISFSAAVDGTVAGNQNFTLTAGTAGDILFSGAVGTGVRLGTLLVSSVKDFTAAANVSAKALTQTNGTGTTTFDTLSTDGAAGIDLIGNKFVFNDAVNTANGGDFSMNNSGLATFDAAADFTLDGTFGQTGAGAVQTAGDITTASSNITFTGPVTLTGNTAFSTGAAAGNILFNDAIDGANDLTLTAGTGNVTLLNTADIKSLTVNGATTARFANNVKTSGNQSITATTIQTNGTHEVTGATNTIALNGNVTLQNDTALTTTNGNVTVTGTVNGAHALNITGGTATTQLQSAVGLTSAPTSLTVNNTGGAVNLVSTVTTTGSQAYTGSTNIGGNLSSTTAGSIVVNGNSTLATNVLIQTAGALATDDITLNGTVTGGTNSLTLSAGIADVLITAAASGLSGIVATAGTIGLTGVSSTGDQAYNGSTTLNGANTYQTTNADFTVNGSTALTGNSVINTTGGDVNLTGAVAGGNNKLTVNATTGNVALGSNATGLSGTDFTAADISLKGVSTTGAQVYNGTTTLAGNLSASTAAAPITINGNTRIENLDPATPDATGVTVSTSDGNIRFNGKVDGTIDYDQRLFVVAGAGNLQFDDSIGSIHPLYELSLDNTGTQTLPAVINVHIFSMSNLNMTQDTTFNMGTGSISLGNVKTNGNDLTLIADEINFTAGDDTVDSVIAGSSLFLMPFTNILDINIGEDSAANSDTTAGMDLTLQDIKALKDGFALISIGSSTAAGKMSIVGATTFKDPVVLQTPAAGGSVYINQALNGIDNASITILGSHATTHLNADITTAGTNILINDKVIVEGVAATRTIDSNGGDIEITDTVEGETIAGQKLRLFADAGNVFLDGSVGSITRLGELTTNSFDITTTDIYASSMNVLSANAATFNGKLNTNDAAGILINGADVNINDTVTTTNNGVFSLTNSGLATITGDMNLDGAFSQSGGTVSTSGDITTTADDILFDSDVTLTGNTQFSTGLGIGDITFNGTINSDALATPRNLTLVAGAGSINFGQTIGNLWALEALVISSAKDVNAAAAITATSITQSAGTGTSTFDAITLSGVPGLNLTGTNFILGDTTSVTGAGITVNNSGTLTVDSGVNVSSDGFFVQNGSGPSFLRGNIATNNSLISFAGKVILDAANVDINSGNGPIIFNDVIDGAGDGINSLTLTAGTGNILFASSMGQAVGQRIGDILINSALNVTANGSITAKSLTQTDGTGTTALNGAVTLNGSGLALKNVNIDINQAVTTTAPGAGNVSLVHSGDLNMISTADMNLIGSFSESGNGAVNLAADIIAAGTNGILFNDAVTLTGNVLMNTTGGDIHFVQAVDATTVGVEGLTLTSGANDIFMDAAVGAGKRLGVVLINNAANVTTSDITAASIKQLAGSDTTTFGGNLDTNTAAGIDLTGNKFNINGDVTTTGNGDLQVTNDSDFTFNSTMLLDGKFLQDGSGDVTGAQGSIQTNGGTITFTSDVELAGDLAMDTTGANLIPAGAAINFISSLHGPYNLTIQSGSASTDFHGAVGDGDPLGDGAGAAYSIENLSLGTTTFYSTLDTNGGIHIINDVIFKGDVTLGDDATFGADLDANVTLEGIQFSAFNGINFGDALTDQLTLSSGPVSVISNDSLVNFNGKVDGSQNLTVDSGTNDTNFYAAVGSVDFIGTGSGPAITISSTGFTTFNDIVNANAGFVGAADSNITFNSDVFADHGFASTFDGNVTLNNIAFLVADGATFGNNNADTLTVTGSAVDIVSDNADFIFKAIVEGPADLLVDAGSGDIEFHETVGAATPLDALTAYGKNVSFADDVTTKFDQAITADTINTNYNNLSNRTHKSTQGDILLGGNVVLRGDTTFETDGNGKDITITGTVDSLSANHKALIVNSKGTVDFQKGIGQTDSLSTLDVANTGTTTRFEGDVTTVNAQNVASGTIQTNGKFETTGGTVTDTIHFTGTTQLQNDTTFKTAGSNVTLTGSVIDALENLTFDVSAADVLVTGSIGTLGARIGQLLIQSVHNFDLNGNIFATSIKQVGSEIDGTTWFHGNMDTNGSAGINLNGNNLTIGTNGGGNTVTTSNGGNFEATHTPTPPTPGADGLLTIYSNMTLDGSFIDNGPGPTNLFGNITTGSGGNILFGGDLLLSGADTILISGGNIEFDGFVDGDTAGANDLTLTAGSNILFKKNVGGGNVGGSFSPLGDLIIVNAVNVTLNQVALATGGALTATSFVQTKGSGTTTVNGINNGITIDTTGTGINLNGTNFVFNTAPVTVNGGNMTVKGTNITFNNSPVIVNNGGNMTLTNTAALTIDSNSQFNLNGAPSGFFLQNGNGSAFTGSSIYTQGGAIEWNDPILTNDVTMNSAGGNISFFDDIDSDAFGPWNLTLDAGAAGNIFVGTALVAANIGANAALNDLIIVNANDMTVFGTITAHDIDIQNAHDVTTNGAIIANSLTQEAAVAGGTTTLNGTVLTTGDNSLIAGGSGNGDGVELNGNAFVLNNTITTQNGGNVEINNGGLLTIAATGDMNLDGSFTQFGGGSVLTAGDIVTTQDDIFFTNDVTLTGASLMTTGSSGIGNITFNDILNGTTAGAENLTLTAGAGDILFNQAVGVPVRLGDILITNAHDVTANGSIFAASLVQNAGSGLDHFVGNVNTNTAKGVDLTGNQFQFDGNVLATAGIINVNASGTIIVGDNLADTMIADQSITLRGDTTTLNSSLESDGDVSGAEGLSVAADRQPTSDILAHNTITSHGGNITLNASSDIVFDAIADVHSNNGNIFARAVSGEVNMAYGPAATNRAEMVSNAGTITVRAGDNVRLGGLISENTTDSAVKVTSDNAQIIDGGEAVSGVALFDIDARDGGVQLEAEDGIGVAAPNGTLEIWTSKLSATTDHNDINIDLNDPLVKGTDLLPGSGPVEIVNASVTGSTGDITIRQLADAPMTVDNASTVDGAINLSSINDLIVTGIVSAAGPNAEVNLTADALPGKNNIGNVIVQSGAVVISQGSNNILGVNVNIFGKVLANNFATITADIDILLGFVGARVFSLTAGRNILDTDGDQANLIALQTSFLTAGGIIGRYFDPLEVTTASGDIIATANGEEDGQSINLHGSIAGDLTTNLTPGLVLFNSQAVAGKPLAAYESGLNQVFNIISFDRGINGMEDLQHAASLQRGLGLVPGIENRFVPTIDTQTSFNIEPNVVVSEKEARLWKRKVRPAVVVPAAPVVVEEVTPVVTPVVTPQIPVAQPQITTPLATPVTTAPTRIVVRPQAVAPVVVVPVQQQPNLAQQAQQSLRGDLQNQPTLQPMTAPMGNRLFQQAVEETPRTDKDKSEQQ